MKPQKTLMIIALLLFAIHFSNAQAYLKLSLENGCNYSEREGSEEYFAYFPTDKAIRIMEEILQASNIPNINFELKSSNVDNAVATVENGIRYILYSPEFINKIEKDAKSRWAVYSVMAHEIGHHLLNHNFAEQDPEKRKQMELEADEYSGRVLMTLCAEEDEALSAIDNLSNYRTDTYYPPKSARKSSISNGWIQQKEDWEKQGKNPCGQVIDLKFGEQYKKLNKAKNVKALVKGEEMVITYDAPGRPGSRGAESFIIVSKYSGLSPQTIDWKTDRTKFGDSRQLIWHFGKDGYTRDHVLKSHDLGIGVFERNKVPYRKSLAGIVVSGSTMIAGGIAVGIGSALKSNAQDDHLKFLQNGESNDPVFGDMTRQEFYQQTNNKHRNAQVISGIGYAVAGLSLIYLVPEIIKYRKGSLGRLYVGENGVGVEVPFY